MFPEANCRMIKLLFWMDGRRGGFGYVTTDHMTNFCNTRSRTKK